MNTHPRIAITGVGLASPLGHSKDELFDALCQGQSAIDTIDRFPVDVFPCQVGAIVKDFKARDWVSNRKNLKLMSTAVRLGMAGVKRAWADAGLTSDSVDPERLGLFVGAGTAVGRTEDLIPAIRNATVDNIFDTGAFGAEGLHSINPLWLLKGLSNNILGFASGDLNAQGPNQNYCNSGVSGLQAIGEAAWSLIEGTGDAIIAGGADSAVNPLHFTGFGRLRALTTKKGPDAVRPFDVEHCGFAPSEGSAFFVLERESHAVARVCVQWRTLQATVTVALAMPSAVVMLIPSFKAGRPASLRQDGKPAMWTSCMPMAMAPYALTILRPWHCGVSLLTTSPP